MRSDSSRNPAVVPLTGIFGSPTKAMDWLTAPCGALENQIPRDLLVRGDVEAVETELGRIGGGIYV